MYCLRCGKETTDEQVFCQACLDNMENYPVKPGVPVQLPHRPAVVPAKKTGKKVKNQSPEELLEDMRKTVRRMTHILLVALLLLLLASGIIFYQWNTYNIGLFGLW